MSQSIVVTTRHRLGTAGVKQRIDDRLASLRTGRLAKVADVDASWEGDMAHVSAKAMGARIKGTVVVTDRELKITIHLPALLMPFRGAIVALIKEQEDAIAPKD